MLRIAQHPFPHEVREIAGFFVREGPGTAHQHEPVGVERLPERGMDILLGIFDESEPLVEMQAPDGYFVLRRVDFQNDAPALCKCREGFRTHVLPAQTGRHGQMLDIVEIPGFPMEEDADELFAAPDAVGFEMRIAERAVVVGGIPAFTVGKRGFVEVPCLVPTLVGAGFEGYELQLLGHNLEFSARYGKFRKKSNPPPERHLGAL